MTGRVVALLFAFLLIGPSCGGSDPPNPTRAPTASPSPSPTPSPTPKPLSGIPSRDIRDLAQRFLGAPAHAPQVAREAPYGYVAGDTEEFFLIDLETPKIITIPATVRLVTDHAYFFVQDGAAYSESSLQAIGSDFETLVYPTVRRDFGAEPEPGVDSDPRITLLHANLSGAGGYFSPSDEYPRIISPRSNEREMLYLDAGILGTPGLAYNTLVAHEFQHLVHWNADPTEDSWVNEGLSQVAAEQVGGQGDWLSIFLDQPDTQLTFWPEIGDSIVHYAAAELFFSYLLDHYGGRDRAKDLLGTEGDSIDGVEEYLSEFGTTFENVFTDWVAANWLDAPEGPYAHLETDTRTGVSTAVEPGDGGGTVGQFGTDYLEVPAGVFTFDGEEEANIGVPAADGPYWWSNRGDGIDTKLTREVELTGLTSATLRFRAWYDIERGWDYAYVAASKDGGKTWRALPGKKTTGYNPVEAAYGPGYTGKSYQWVPEEVDLGAYAGKRVLLRFEYVTDDASSFTGMAIDDIEIPESGFTDRADSDNGWSAEGFVRLTEPPKQEFVVQVIEDGQEPEVLRVALDTSNRGKITLDRPAVIAISGATRGTAEAARYTWTFR